MDRDASSRRRAAPAPATPPAPATAPAAPARDTPRSPGGPVARGTPASATAEAPRAGMGYVDMLRGIVEDAAVGFAVLDTDLRYLYVNPHMARATGVPAAAYPGHTQHEVLPHIRRPDQVLRDVIRDGRPREAIVTGRTWVDSPYQVREWRCVYHRLVDGTGRVVGVAAVGLEISEPQQYVYELERAHRRLALLDSAASRIGTGTDVAGTCRELAEFVVPELADAAGVELSPPDTASARRTPTRLAAYATRPGLATGLAALDARGELVGWPRGTGTRRNLAAGRIWRRNAITTAQWRSLIPRWAPARACLAARVHSVLLAPLVSDGRVLGILLLARAGDSGPFSNEDATVARELAARAARALDRAVRFEREHTMALELQRALLAEPGQLQQHAGVETTARYRPADDGSMIGGDWYDVLALPDGRTMLVIGDVMGHGVDAAVAMSHYRSTLRALALAGLSPRRILRHADRMVADSGFERVATCFLALGDPDVATLTYASAGHLPPVWLTPEGEMQLVPVPVGPPLGSGLGRYEQGVAPERGGVLLLYTDGLVERRGEDIDRGLARLTGLSLCPTDPLDKILDTVLAHLAGGSEDDIALLAARAVHG
ncbi:MAG: SpoIIE family protein phosphatase [Streptomyces sp.]|uniref:SpoIIE family protein phosphatase n=1 Tax=Streptomyces sp. TaxID=1931 RepID=UPI0025CDCFD0|nr:SpoIIE family protein phosphatase [Streptomyces sp.]MBW8795513.1 SpoIIE family protein phosphatase [Streptomyces sp.]